MAARLRTPPGRELLVCEPLQARGLTVYPIRGEPVCVPEVMLLSDALRAGDCVVHETGRVGRLELEVAGPHAVFGLGGQLMRNGRQDRALRHDVVVSAADRVFAPTMCVEKARWGQRRGTSVRCFEASGQLAPSSMRTLLMTGASQKEVWYSVSNTQGDLGRALNGRSVRDRRSVTSLALSLSKPMVRNQVAEIVDPLLEELPDGEDVLGHVVVGPRGIGGPPIHAEWFASSDLFRRLQRRLLESSVIAALASGADVGPHSQPREIARLVEQALAAPDAAASPAGAAWITTRRSDEAVVAETTWGEAAPLHVVAVAR